MYARVAVNVSGVSDLFDYAIPPELESQVQPGCLVTAPFGSQTVQGVVLQRLISPSVPDPKPLNDLLDSLPVLNALQLTLAINLAETTLNPLAAIINLMLPTGLSQQADVQYALAREEVMVKDIPPVQQRLLSILKERGALRGRQIDAHFARVEWRKSATALVRAGILAARHVLPAPRVRPKYLRVAQLAVAPEQALAAMDTLGTRQTLARRQAALRFLLQQPEPINLSWVYAETRCTLGDLQELEERGLIRLFENEIFRDPLSKSSNPPADSTSQPLALTPDQAEALSRILPALQPGTAVPPFMLFGVTGSGKTEIYLQAAAEVIRQGRQVIILVPEIALTPQAVRRFTSRFPGQVGLVHSRLSEGERYDTWRRARLGQLQVVIGARSALFAPLPDVGLIVVDECHDSSFFQSEPPYYHAVSAAQEYARLCGAACVLGSATPTVEQRYGVEHGSLTRLELPQRVSGNGLPPVEMVDMRTELKSGNRSIFSRLLTESLAETLARGEQAILFLNRRGTATYVFCRDCGLVSKCPNCDTPLTLHSDEGNRLLCHHCNISRAMPRTCPACHGTSIRAYGLGSEKVEAEVQAMFPQARTLRWDWDTTRQKGAHEMILTHFINHQADVLVGTQMLAKGLDLPLVTLVGIVLADVGLNLPDPFAAERVFQTLTQVAGRAGRSALGGRVVLQTFMPHHYALQYAAQHDVNGFYLRELEYRRLLGYPPFGRLVRLEYRHSDPEKAKAQALEITARLRERIAAEEDFQTEIIGPAPCFFSKVDGISRWQLVLRGTDPAALLRGWRIRDWRIEVDPISLL